MLEIIPAVRYERIIIGIIQEGIIIEHLIDIDCDLYLFMNENPLQRQKTEF